MATVCPLGGRLAIDFEMNGEEPGAAHLHMESPDGRRR
jgi:hypothetical protein